MLNAFLALTSVFSALVVSFLVLSFVGPQPSGYSFEDRAQLQMLVDACRTGHHLCNFK